MISKKQTLLPKVSLLSQTVKPTWAYFTNLVDREVKKFFKKDINKDEIMFADLPEIKNAIKSLKSNKAPGKDGISTKILKNSP